MPVLSPIAPTEPQPLTASSTALLQPGNVVAQRYKVLVELGRGGMGIVYLCHDFVSGERVALKCVFFDRSKPQSKDVLWFQQEARALAALDHPAIVRARDFGVLADGSPYLVMDALQGRSVHVWKYLGAIPWPVLWTLADQVLAGLAHAHARGVIHGDLKPSNLMVDPRNGLQEPRVYILDLGLAWLLADHLDPRLDVKRPRAPTLPFGLGTPGWMAPEQIRNAVPHIGPPTDLYALGSILFELLTRVEVFEGKSNELLRQHRDAPVPPITLPADVPPGVAGFVTKLLAKRPWHRFRLAADARATWQAFRPKGSIHWQAPHVRLADDPPLTSLLAAPSSPRQDGDNENSHTLSLAPGILALRPSPMVGRELERRELWREAIALVARVEPLHRLVLLRGEAGVGKSRLAEWLCESAHEKGSFTPLRARYRRIPGPLDGMRGAIMNHYTLVGQTREVIEQALLNEWEIDPRDEQGRTWVAATAEWLHPNELGPQSAVGPSGKRFFLDKPELRWVIIRQVLERLGAQGRPLLLWIDDIHLAPTSLFLGLQQLHREAPSLPFLLLATARDEALAADVQATQRLEGLLRIYPAHIVPVQPLSDTQMRALLQASLPLSNEAEEAVIARSHGSPLFALQLVHAWASGGHLELSISERHYAVRRAALHGHASTTAELWDERLHAVDDTLRPAAYAAAALGEVIRIDVFYQLLSRMNLNPNDSLHALQKAELLLVEGGERVRWPHALLQEHVFARLLASPDASQVFRLAAEVLALHPQATSRRIVRQRTSNLLFAGDKEAAAALLLDYIARAWTRARDVLETRSDLAMLEGVITGVQVAHHLRWRAETERHAGNLTEARAHAEEARHLFQTQGDDENEAHCLRLLAHIASDQGTPALGRIEAILARTKFEALGHQAGKAECAMVLGEIDYLLGDHASARAHLAQAAQLFRHIHNTLGLAQCLNLQALSEQAAGRIDSARELLMQARILFDDIGYQLGLAQVDVALAHVDHRAGEWSAAYQTAWETKQRFRDLENPRGEAACERLLSMATFNSGQYELARKHAHNAYQLYNDKLSDPVGKAESEVLLAQVALLEGNRDQARMHLNEAMSIPLDEAEPLQHRHLTAAWLLLETGHMEAAIAEIYAAEKVFPDRRRTGDHTVSLLFRLLDKAEGTIVAEPIRNWITFLRFALTTAAATPLPT